MNNAVADVFAQDTMTSLFYSSPRINDCIFCIFYTEVCFKLPLKLGSEY